MAIQVNDLPPRLYAGRTARIYSGSRLDVDLDLWFGCTRRVTVNLEGLPAVPPTLRQQALRCLVIAVGGKAILAQIAQHTDHQAPVIARLFLNDIPATLPGDVMAVPYGTDTPLLDVTAFMRHAACTRFDEKQVAAIIRGKVPANADVTHV